MRNKTTVAHFLFFLFPIELLEKHKKEVDYLGKMRIEGFLIRC